MLFDWSWFTSMCLALWRVHVPLDFARCSQLEIGTPPLLCPKPVFTSLPRISTYRSIDLATNVQMKIYASVRAIFEYINQIIIYIYIYIHTCIHET